ncbi:unnamed protein product [Prunus armeniaca]
MDWVKIDKALLSCLITMLSNDAIECVIGCKTAHDAWMNLTDPYAIVSRASINHLKIELQTAHKGSYSIEKFLLRLKHIRNHLAVTRVSVSDDYMMIAALNGLHSEYDMIKTILVAFDTSLSFKYFCNQLFAAEQAAEACMLSSHAPMVGMLSQSSPSISSHVLSGSSHGDVVEANSLVLDILASFKVLLRLVVVLFLSVKYAASEICGKKGDGALDYFHRSNYIYQGSLPPASLTAMTAQTFFSPDAVWIVDSGASHHMVPHMTIMDSASPCTFLDQVRVENGEGLHIDHIDTTHIPIATSSSLSLSTDKITNRVLFQGKSDNGLYPIPCSFPSSTSVANK